MRLIDADVLIKHLCEIMTTANHFGNIERVSEIGACIGVIKGEKTIERSHGKWYQLKYNDDEKVTHTNFPIELDGCWVLVTDGKRISVERIKKDIPDDHFFPDGRWFDLNEVVAWMPLPEPYKKDS